MKGGSFVDDMKLSPIVWSVFQTANRKNKLTDAKQGSLNRAER